MTLTWRPQACIRRFVVLLAIAAPLFLGGCSSFRQRTIENRILADELAARGQDALHCGQQDQAIRLLYGAVAKKPNDVATRAQLAEALAACGRTAAAIEQLRIATERTEPQVLLLVRLAELCAENGQLAEAIDSADKALRTDPQSADAWRIKGDVAYGKGDLDLALAHYQRALRFATDQEALWLRVARVYRETGRPERALSTLETLAHRHPPGAVPTHLVQLQSEILGDLNQRERAVRLLVDLTDRDDCPASGFLQLGHLQAARHDFGAAQVTWSRGQQRFPTDSRFALALESLRNHSVAAHPIAHRD